MLASMVYSGPRNLPIVRAFAGDSTITSDFPTFEPIWIFWSYSSYKRATRGGPSGRLAPNSRNKHTLSLDHSERNRTRCKAAIHPKCGADRAFCGRPSHLSLRGRRPPFPELATYVVAKTLDSVNADRHETHSSGLLLILK